MCKICEMNKKLGIPNYVCIQKIYETKEKWTKMIDLPLRTKK